jgi:shikimate dehydrogenase
MPERPKILPGHEGKRLFGLIGFPLSHSFSKKYFTEKFEKEGLTDCRYELFPIRSINELGELIRQNPGLEGINVTIPYKQQVLPYLSSLKGIPESLRACNCIRIENGQLLGYNTDWIGFEKSILPFVKSHHKKALVLGNGGATAAVVFALDKLGIGAAVVSRVLHQGSSLTYEEIDENVMDEHTIIINTTPLGLFPNADSCPDIPYQFITSKHLLYDLVYNPVKTLFLQQGEERGAVIKNGEEMLVIQAEESWRIWNS